MSNIREDEIRYILCVLKDYWLTHPELRLGQLIENAVTQRNNNNRHCCYYITDEELLKEILLGN